MDDNAPVGASVFTTLRWEGGRVAWLEEHLNRLRTHAKRLGIGWPGDFNERLTSTSPIGEGDLCQVKLTRAGQIELTLRQTHYSPSPLCAISHAAPRFTRKAQGTKHAAWSPYTDARTAAENAGADIALLVHDGAVVDGDRCTPIILDSDGVAYAPSLEGGGIDSITLSILRPAIEAAGIPFRYARLTEKLLGRASELIVVGTGIGVAWLDEIDGHNVGIDSPGPLYETCYAAFATALDTAWSTMG
jgi:branched-subunit amino acid aminotransferase/4-amino-4-deoxychorismate lyase